jgi:hypothetical protein
MRVAYPNISASGTDAAITARRAALEHAADAAAARREVADDIAHVLLRHHHLDVEDRLEQARLRLRARLLERHRARDLERHLEESTSW